MRTAKEAGVTKEAIIPEFILNHSQLAVIEQHNYHSKELGIQHYIYSGDGYETKSEGYPVADLWQVAIFRVKLAKGSIHERLGAKILLQ